MAPTINEFTLPGLTGGTLRLARYAPTTKPAELTAEIERLLSIPPVEV